MTAVLVFEKDCAQCKKYYPMDNFISMVSGKECKTCIRCRDCAIRSRSKATTKACQLKTHYDRLKASLPPCVFCGDSDTFHKQFDHIDPATKLYEVRYARSIKAMDEEAAKCQAVCIKCHCKRTAEQQQTLKTDNVNTAAIKSRKVRNYAYVDQRKLDIGGCQNDCGDIFDSDNLRFYEFDHQDISTKVDTVSAMAKNCVSLSNLQREIEKCTLLCAYCHLRRTLQQKKDKVSRYRTNWAVDRPEKEKKEKLTDEQVKSIRKRYQAGESVKQIHNDFSQVSYTQIWYITHNKSRVTNDQVVSSC